MAQEAKELSLEETLEEYRTTLGLVAKRYGYVFGQKKVRGDLMRKMIEHGLMDLRNLSMELDKVVDGVMNGNIEAKDGRKRRNEIVTKMQAIKKEIMENTVDEKQAVKRWNTLIKIYDEKVVSRLKKLDLLEERYEMDEDDAKEVEERISKDAKGEK